MSYKNVFYGSISDGNIYSKGDILEKSLFLPDIFLNQSFVETVKNQGYDLRFHIQVYNSINNINYHSKNIGVTFYLTNKPIIYPEDIKMNLDNCDAQVQTHIDDNNDIDGEDIDNDECDDENELIIKWVGTKDGGRGKGFAKKLILLACLYSKIISPRVIFTKLDDDSDNYANGIKDNYERELAQSKNIYCKLGYEYEDKSGGPEMVGNIDEILNNNGIVVEQQLKRKINDIIDEPESSEPVSEIRRSKRLRKINKAGGKKKKRKYTRKSKKKSKRKYKKKSKKKKNKK